MKKFLLPALAATLLLAATAVAAPLDAFKGMKGTLDIAGGTAHIPVMKEAAKRIMTANPDIRITVAGGGSGVGVQQVGEGLVQIGNTGRPLKDKEIEKFGLKTFPFAIDGVALVVNPANNVSDITTQQAADIYNGKITNWKELGGTDAPITLYTREDGSGTREVFVERALNKGSIVQSANVVNSNGAMKTAVAQDKQSIGYVGIGHVDKNVKALVFDKMVPSQENAFFLSMQYKRINVRSVEILVKKYSSIVTPLKKITPHKLRSTYGTRLYNETGDIYIVADVLGHKDVNTTKKHYAAISEDNRKEVADAVKLRQEPDDTPPGDKN